MDKGLDFNLGLFSNGFNLGQGQLPGQVNPVNPQPLPEFDGFIVGRVGLGTEVYGCLWH